MACARRARERPGAAWALGGLYGCLGGRPTAWVGCGGAWRGRGLVPCDGPGEVLQDLKGPAGFNLALGVHAVEAWSEHLALFVCSGYRATSSNGTARCYLISQLSASWACRSMVEFDALWLRSEQEGMLLPVKPRIFILGSESYLCTYTERVVVSDH